MSCSVWPLSLLEAGFLCYSSTALAGGYSCVTPPPPLSELMDYLWLAETSQQPISQTTWLKVTPHCNHCNHLENKKNADSVNTTGMDYENNLVS